MLRVDRHHRTLAPRQGGFAILEYALALSVTIAAFGLLVSATIHLGKSTASFARETRVRFILEGELERLRALPETNMATWRNREFTPFLEIPDSLKGVVFYGTARPLSGQGHLALELKAVFPRGSRLPQPVRVHGVLPVRESVQ